MEEMDRRAMAGRRPRCLSSLCRRQRWQRPMAPNDGKELHPGVRLVELGTFSSDIPAYKSITMVDIVFQPGAVAPEEVMDNDMMCSIAAG
jgi:hypothetical protein